MSAFTPIIPNNTPVIGLGSQPQAFKTCGDLHFDPELRLGAREKLNRPDSQWLTGSRRTVSPKLQLILFQTRDFFMQVQSKSIGGDIRDKRFVGDEDRSVGCPYLHKPTDLFLKNPYPKYLRQIRCPKQSGTD